MSILSKDFETRSTVNLKNTGAYVYAAHPSTVVLCLGWAFDDEEPEIWTPDMPFPERIADHINEGGECRAWNAAFERIVWKYIMAARLKIIEPKLDQWVCTAAEASAMALPRALDRAAKVLGVAEKKDEAGSDLMHRMTKPRKHRKGEDPNGIYYFDDTERLGKLYDYCKQDVRSERSVGKALRRLSPHEREIYLLDQRINDRGVPFDIPLVDAAQRIVDRGKDLANAEIFKLTGGAVTEIGLHADLTDWLVGQGVETDSVAKPAVAAMLEGELPEHVRVALELRADAGRSSLAKLAAMKNVAGLDGYARGLHLYHAASTGRWGGKLIQTQNFPRGSIVNVESFIPAIMRDAYDEIDILEHPLIVVSSLLRSMIRAPEGYDLMAGDYSAIEARILNWLAGQDDVVESFAAMDAGDKSRHPYKIMAVKMGRAARSEDVVKGSIAYQAGKAAELGCGFQMGAEKFVRAAWEVYQVRVTDEEAEVAVKAYRSSHNRVRDFWYDTEGAVKNAISTPGAPFKFGGRRNLTAVVAGAYLYIVLPSGRPLMYAGPRVFDAETSWGSMKPTIHYKGINPHPSAGGAWGTLRTYGGHLVENIVQAVARDLLADAMLRAESRGYLPVMHVHDEAVVLVPKEFGSIRDFELLMSELPTWATGCPVSAEAWRGERYRK